MRDEKRKRVLVLCPYPVGVAPSQRLKYEQYFAAMEEHGYEITVSPFMSRRMWGVVYRRGRLLTKAFWTLVGYLRRLLDLVRAPAFDVVYVHLWVTPFGPPLFERLLLWRNGRVLYDIDDLIWIGQEGEKQRLIGRLKGRTKPLSLMSGAKHVITCTPYLDEYARKYNENTTDISSTIDTDVYIPANAYRNDRELTIGWSGSHSTSQYLSLLEQPLAALQERFRFRLLVIGDVDFRMPALRNVDVIRWDRSTEVEDLRRIDIGVYPLPDEQWVYGKSGLKALQYMALGIPPVATAIGANFRVIEDGVSGFLVNSMQEWESVLAELLESPSRRREVGKKARERVVEHYSIKANAGKYLEALSAVSGSRG